MGVFTSELPDLDSATSKKNAAYYFKKIGVSVLFSGAAVGVSHVVQATRAGADFSLGLVPLILACLVLKYPAFLFGPLFTSVTNHSVVAGYAKIGKWTLPIVGLSFLSVMFTVVAAVAMLAAGIFVQTFGIQVNGVFLALLLVFGSTALSVFSSFSKFQNSMKIVFLLLLVMSVLAVGLAIPTIETGKLSLGMNFGSLTPSQIFFIAALVGWMPAGLDLPMMHSQWILANQRKAPLPNNVIEDFNFGYLSTTLLALLFVVIGAVFFYGNDVAIAASAGGFSKQLLAIYRSTLGTGAGILMGGTLFLAIFSTLYVVIDGFPRVLSEVFLRMGPQSQSTKANSVDRFRKPSAWLQAIGASALLIYFAGSLRNLVHFATLVSFVLGPLFAVLNHRLISLETFKEKRSVSTLLRTWSLVGITFFTAFTAYYLWLTSNAD